MKSKIQKKLKDKKIAELDKVEDAVATHTCMCVVENTELPAALIHRMRKEMSNTKIMFVKKNMFCKKYEKHVNKYKNFFIVFTDVDGICKLKTYTYETYLQEGDLCGEAVWIDKGQIKDKELAEMIPTLTVNNVHMLQSDWKVCDKDQILTEKQSQILKQLKLKLKTKHLNILNIVTTSDINK